MPNYSTQPNVNEGRGNIGSRGRRKNKKPRKSQPHAKNKKPRTKKTKSWESQPLFPGGITTKGEFVKGRQGAVRQEFGDTEQQIKTEEAAIPAWYDDYLKKLQGLQTQTTEQYKGLQGQAASLAETAADATPDGKKAAESRSQIVAAIQGALLQQGGAAFTRNQEMQGIAGMRKDQRVGEVNAAKTKLAKDKGAFRATYTSEHKQTEFENALLAKQFNLKVAQEANDQKNEANKPKPESTYDKEFSKQAAKYGRTKHDWALLGPKGRAKVIQEAQRRSGKPGKSLKRIEKEENIKQAARFGYSAEDWAALPSQKRSAIIRGANKKDKDKSVDKGSEHTWAPPGTQNKGANQASALTKYINDNKKKGRPAVAKAILESAENPDNPALVSAALDAAYDGHLSRETARRLQAAGYKATAIARALGTKTYTERMRTVKKVRKPKKTKAFTNPFN